MKRKYWHDTRLPAELFFEILESGKLKRLTTKGKASKGDLRKAWSKILDEFFELKNDSQLKIIIRTKKEILNQSIKIKTIENTMRVLSVVSLPRETVENIVEKLKDLHIHIDLEKPLNKEILRVLEVDLAGLKTRLEIENDKLKGLTKGAKATFEENCVNIEGALGRSISEGVSLRKYVAYEKQGIKVSKKSKKK